MSLVVSDAARGSGSGFNTADAGLRPWQQVSSMASLHARLAAIPSYLLLVSASRQIPHSDCRPAKFAHDLAQPPICARRPMTLWQSQTTCAMMVDGKKP